MFDLSIVIITCNRSKYLQRLLDSLSRSVFRECEIWVLNNASTDNTLQVCEEYKKFLKSLNIVTHKFNIGGDANILRAYEYGDKYYKWILCDDDILNLEEVDDLVEVFNNKKYDLIRIGDLGVVEEERGKGSTLGKLLHDPQSLTFYSLGFVPNLIFRNVVGQYVQCGYTNIQTRYQQLFVLLGAFDMETKMYTTKKSLLSRGEASGGIGSEIWLHQIRSLAALPTKRSKKIAVGWRSSNQKLLFYIFVYARLILRDLEAGRPRRTIARILITTLLATPLWSMKLILLLNSIFILFPKKFIYFLEKIYYFTRRKKREIAMKFKETYYE